MGSVNTSRTLPFLAILFAAGCATEPMEPIDPNKRSYFVDVEFTVAPDGRTTDAKVVETDAPKQLQQEALEEVRRYRAEPAAEATRGRRRIEFAVQ